MGVKNIVTACVEVCIGTASQMRVQLRDRFEHIIVFIIIPFDNFKTLDVGIGHIIARKRVANFSMYL